MSISQAAADKTRDWLKRTPGERFSPSLFFGRVWAKHKIVTIGERHCDAAHRAFVAQMVTQSGGPQNGLALEVSEKLQGGVDAYLSNGATLPQGWYSDQTRYKAIFAAARGSLTPVVCMDEAYKPSGKFGEPVITLSRTDRDRHMADRVAGLAKQRSKVLVFVGMAHASEAVTKGTPSMGARLAKEFGPRHYTVCTMTPQGHGHEAFYQTLKAEFGREGAIAFDLDRSPLARELITDSAVKQSIPWKSYADGVMMFFGN